MRPFSLTVCATVFTVCALGSAVAYADATTTSSAKLTSGIDLRYFDSSVRPQDNIYRALNGKWLDSFEMPADKGRYGAFDELRDHTERQLGAIMESVSHAKSAPKGSETQKIRDLYLSFMNEAKIEALGISPLAETFQRIDAAKNRADLVALIAYLNRLRIDMPYRPFIHQDNRDSTKYVVDLRQDGLGLPDRDYYSDERFKTVRSKYLAHIEKMLSMAGERDAAASAQGILALENELAEAQWTRVANRDPVKLYNKVTLEQLRELAPAIDWNRWLVESGIESRVGYLIVGQPSYLKRVSELLLETPIDKWKAYFKWKVIKDAAPYLTKAFVDESFAFQSTVLRGIPENPSRWKRGVEFVDASIGHAVGKIYVAHHFPPENLRRVEALVGNLLAAYRQSIDTLDWMGRETKLEAQAKLAKISPKIGYPKRWRDYSNLTVVADDLIGNWMRAQMFEYERSLAKLGKPIDRDEWRATPQTVNAYYNRELNEIVFPAAILQPPFFNVEADDAANYGAIGSVIGHEISHGFDDGGSRYDGDGNLRQWFTDSDLKNFKARTRALATQYDQYEPVPGFHVNGSLTLGENVADNSGLAIAYKAYKISLAGRAAPVYDGLTGEQRLYYGFVQVWRGKAREPETIRRLKIDPHSPQEVRGYATLRNQPGFYEAFGVKEGDKMYLAPEQRVGLW